MKTLIRSARIQKIIESKILEILKKGLKKKILDELNFMIWHGCLFLNKNIYLIFINEKINFFALSICDCNSI